MSFIAFKSLDGHEHVVNRRYVVRVFTSTHGRIINDREVEVRRLLVEIVGSVFVEVDLPEYARLCTWLMSASK